MSGSHLGAVSATFVPFKRPKEAAKTAQETPGGGPTGLGYQNSASSRAGETP